MTAQPYKPELRTIPLTFLDCNQRWWESEMTMVDGSPRYSCQYWYLEMGTVYLCETCRRDGKCPRGFP